MSNFNPSTASFSQLKDYCQQNNIVIDGDRRCKKSYQLAIATHEFMDVNVGKGDDAIAPYLTAKEIGSTETITVKTVKVSSVQAFYPIAFIVAILILTIAYTGSSVINATIRTVKYANRRWFKKSKQPRGTPCLLAIPI